VTRWRLLSTRSITSVCMVYVDSRAVSCRCMLRSFLVTSTAKADTSFTYMSWKGRKERHSHSARLGMYITMNNMNNRDSCLSVSPRLTPPTAVGEKVDGSRSGRSAVRKPTAPTYVPVRPFQAGGSASFTTGKISTTYHSYISYSTTTQARHLTRPTIQPNPSPHVIFTCALARH
jgi:hypothetical protein